MVPNIQIRKMWWSRIELTWDEIPLEERNGVIKDYKFFYWHDKGPVKGKLSVSWVLVLDVLWCLTFSFSCDCRSRGEEVPPGKSPDWSFLWRFYDRQHIWREPEWVNNSFSERVRWLVPIWRYLNIKTSQHIQQKLTSWHFLFFRHNCYSDSSSIYHWIISADNYHLHDLFLQKQKVISLLCCLKLYCLLSLNIFSVPPSEGWRETFGQLFQIQPTAASKYGHQNPLRYEKLTAATDRWSCNNHLICISWKMPQKE